MAKEKTIYVELNANQNFIGKFISGKKDCDFSDISLLRKLLSNEKSRILHIIKNEKISSIYALAKMLDRDLKSVRQDLKLLERFGFIGYYAQKTGKRQCLIPYLMIDSLKISVNI
ncbi:MAG: hypothetical protein ACOYT4_01010 [Nanoarchaeota archaeon]